MGAVGSAGGGSVSPLRRRMIQDMELAGLTAGTQKAYIRAVVDVVRHYGGKRPEALSEEEVYRYIVWLRDEHRAALGTFQTRFAGLKFLFYRTLDRDWPLSLEAGAASAAEAAAAGAVAGGMPPPDRSD